MKLLPGLGFQAIGESDDGRFAVTTRMFPGSTAGGTRCHDHNDPRPSRDSHSLPGVYTTAKAGIGNGRTNCTA